MVLQKVSTSLKVEEWGSELVGHPDEELVGYVLSGIREGFRVGFDYSKHTCVSARANLLSAGENKQVVDDYLREECTQGRVVHMGARESVDGLHISPFGVIPKGHQTGKWRLIVDLSSPHGESVNDGIDQELCTLSYISVDDIVRRIIDIRLEGIGNRARAPYISIERSGDTPGSC